MQGWFVGLAIAGHDAGGGLQYRIECGVVLVRTTLAATPGADLAGNDVRVYGGELLVRDAE